MAAATQHLNRAEEFIGQDDYASAQAALDLAQQCLISSEVLLIATHHWLQAVIYYHKGLTEQARR